MNGHEIKLAGETGETCGRVTLPIRVRHGSRDGQTVVVESEILSIKHTYGNSVVWEISGMRAQACILPRDLWFWLRVERGCGDFVILADKSRAWFVQV